MATLHTSRNLPGNLNPHGGHTRRGNLIRPGSLSQLGIRHNRIIATNARVHMYRRREQ